MSTKSKLRNKKVCVNGITFASKLEAKFYEEMLSLQKEGKVVSLKLQPRFELQPKFKDMSGKTIRSIEYVADFDVTYSDGRRVIYDTKGWALADCKMKRKMFLYKYQDIMLKWIDYRKKYGGWVDWFELQKINRKKKRDGRK